MSRSHGISKPVKPPNIEIVSVEFRGVTAMSTGGYSSESPLRFGSNVNPHQNTGKQETYITMWSETEPRQFLTGIFTRRTGTRGFQEGHWLVTPPEGAAEPGDYANTEKGVPDREDTRPTVISV
ncbi:hypothetical protein R1sor_005332 [Riccia sorocarpa]|uniref:Uncharacterized protein n=1 Tax=Riccia sorocarpa TaxID=122646 RepID=A0ABD3HL77_9MARC